MDSETLCAVYLDALKIRRPDRMLFKSGGAWRPLSTDDIERRVRSCAGALAAAGVGRGDRVALLSYNRPEWAIVDYATLILGAASVPIYSTLPADQVTYILQNSGAKLIVVENAAQAAKVQGLRTVCMESAPEGESFGDFLKAGESFTDAELRRRAAEVKPDDLATLIYTSGTTGVPKGVMLTHRNLVSNLVSTDQVIEFSGDDVALSFLPVSHVFERLVDYALWYKGASIAYAESVDKVSENLLEVRPTLMGAVPRFYEKVYGRIQEAVASLPPKKKAMFDWARSVGALEATFRMRGRKPPLGLRWRFWWAKRLVLRKFHARVGGRMRLFVSGGAPLSRDIADFFFSLGFTILEGYGLSETSPVLACNSVGAVRLGTVGKPIPGVEIRIAEDGEILARGPNIMKGYYGMPAETAEVVKDGWFHTGDIGEFDKEGFLRITDRKKDLLKTSGGKYIAPQPIENRLKMNPLIANAVVIGDRQKFASALIVPARGATRAQVQAAVDAVNEDLAHHEALKKFALVDQDFTIEGGELTPTMKVKRRVVEKKYKALIDELYRE